MDKESLTLKRESLVREVESLKKQLKAKEEELKEVDNHYLDEIIEQGIKEHGPSFPKKLAERLKSRDVDQSTRFLEHANNAWGNHQ